MNINLERLHEALDHRFQIKHKIEYIEDEINSLEKEKEETIELLNDIEEEIKEIIKGDKK